MIGGDLFILSPWVPFYPKDVLRQSSDLRMKFRLGEDAWNLG